jgi:uncharacterized phage protein (TIGR01671 family)
MREVKWRAWDLVNKKMYLVKAFCFHGAKTATLQYNTVIKRKIDFIELMQSTGFNDKNDTETIKANECEKKRMKMVKPKKETIVMITLSILSLLISSDRLEKGFYSAQQSRAHNFGFFYG